MTYRADITDIEYDINDEDLDLDMNDYFDGDFFDEEEYDNDAQEKITFITDSLPSTMSIELEDVDENDNIEELLADAITNETSWLVKTFNYSGEFVD